MVFPVEIQHNLDSELNKRNTNILMLISLLDKVIDSFHQRGYHIAWIETRCIQGMQSSKSLKNDNIDYSISWRVLSSNSPYNSSSKRCNLCLKEKFLIIYRPDLSSLNKRNELVSSCRHRNKALLRNSWTLKFLSLPRIM